MFRCVCCTLPLVTFVSTCSRVIFNVSYIYVVPNMFVSRNGTCRIDVALMYRMAQKSVIVYIFQIPQMFPWFLAQFRSILLRTRLSTLFSLVLQLKCVILMCVLCMWQAISMEYRNVTDRRTDNIAISKSCISKLTHDKNSKNKISKWEGQFC